MAESSENPFLSFETETSFGNLGHRNQEFCVVGSPRKAKLKTFHTSFCKKAAGGAHMMYGKLKLSEFQCVHSSIRNVYTVPASCVNL